MRDSINTWRDYRTLVREFDAVLEHGKAVAAVIKADAPSAAHVHYGQQIYAKLLGHCVALRRLTPDPLQAPPSHLTELSSMGALARCVIEAYDAFDYVAGHVVPDEERSFRIRLWELHDATRRFKILSSADAVGAAADTLRADMKRLREGLEEHPHLASLPADLQAELRRRFVRGDAPAFHLNQRQRCALSGIDADWHQVVTLQLSQHVHTLPFSLHQLHRSPAEEADSVNLLTQPIACTLPFLARATVAVVPLMMTRAPEPPSRTARTMQAWRQIGQRPD